MADERTPQIGDLVSHEGCWGAEGDQTPYPGRDMNLLAARIAEAQDQAEADALQSQLDAMALDPANYIVPGPFRITGFNKRPALSEDGESAVLMDFTIFENELHRVECLTAELVFLEEDDAWMLPGRLLTKEQRSLWQQTLGVKQGPPADKHVEARAYLRMMGKPQLQQEV